MNKLVGLGFRWGVVITLFSFWVSPSLVYSQFDTLIFAEQFNACSLPAGWQVASPGNPNAIWYVGIPRNPAAKGLSIDSTCMLVIDDDATGDKTAPFVLTAASPSFNTSGWRQVFVYMDVYFRNADGKDTMSIQVFDGVRWNNIAQYHSRNYTDTTFNNHTSLYIDITSMAGPNTRLRVRYNDGNTWAWYCGIDNVYVIANQKSTSVLKEGFNTCSKPVGWTTEVISGNTDWTFGISNNTKANPKSMNGSCFAFFDDDALGDTVLPSKVRLISPVFNGLGNEKLFLDFDLVFRRYAALESFRIFISSGGKVVPIRTWYEEVGAQWSDFQRVAVDLSAFKSSSMQLIFEYDDVGDWNWWVGIDNVSISGQGVLNDQCATASSSIKWNPISNPGNFPQDFLKYENTFAATTDNKSCLPGANTTGTLWYKVNVDNTIPNAALYSTLLLNSQINVYTGNCQNLIHVPCEKIDEHGFTGDIMYFPGNGNYYVSISGLNSKFGSSRGLGYGNFLYNFPRNPVKNANDDCQNPFRLSFGENQINVNRFSNIDATNISSKALERHDVWLTFEMPRDQDIALRTLKFFSQELELFRGDNCNNLVSVPLIDEGEFYSAKGLKTGKHYVRVSGNFATIQGISNISVDLLSPVTPVPNDTCNSAMLIPLDGTCNEIDLRGEKRKSYNSPCDANMLGDVWYRFVAPTGGRVKMMIDGDFPVKMTLYRGNCQTRNWISCIEQADLCGSPNMINNLIVGQNYLIQVSFGSGGDGIGRGKLCLRMVEANMPDPISQLKIQGETVCLGNGFVLARGIPSGGIPPYKENTFEIFKIPYAASSFPVQVTDSRNCFANNAISVPSNCAIKCDLPLTNNIFEPYSCAGINNGEISLNVPSGGNPIFLEETTSGLKVSASNTFKNLKAGAYKFRVVNENGCVGIAEINLIGRQAPTVSLVSVKPTNQGFNTGKVVLNFAGGIPPLRLQVDGILRPFSFLDAMAAGTYEIKILDSIDCISNSLTAVVSSVTSTNEITNLQQKIKVYPNPSSTEVNVDLPEIPSGEIKMMDMIGNTVFQWNRTDSSLPKMGEYYTRDQGNSQLSTILLVLPKLIDGTYLLEFDLKGKKVAKKILIMN
jgi:hypothetical protein